MLAHRLIEKVVAKAFDLDPESRVKLAALDETFIGLEVSSASGGIRHVAVLRVHDGAVELATPHSLEPDVQVRGSLSAVLRFLASWFRNDNEARQHVVLDGDICRLEHIIAVCRGLEPDWEEHLAERVGDVPARHLGTLVRTFAGWAQKVHERGRDAGAEFLQYESGAAPARSEWEDHVARLAELDRRLARIERRMSGK